MPKSAGYTAAVFRSDRDALATEVEELRREQGRLRAENEAMRADLLAQRQHGPLPVGGTVYKFGPHRLTPGERAAIAGHRLSSFPVWGVLLAHFATLGVFSFVHFSSMHDRIPQAERDDPSAAKAIGLSFIPYFNLYWMVWNALRLTDRINLQLRLRGQRDGVPRGVVMAFAILGQFPYLGFLFWTVVAMVLQRGVNQLVALPLELHAIEEARAVALPAQEFAGAARALDAGAPAPWARVEDLPPQDAQLPIEADPLEFEEADPARRMVR